MKRPLGHYTRFVHIPVGVRYRPLLAWGLVSLSLAWPLGVLSRPLAYLPQGRGSGEEKDSLGVLSSVCFCCFWEKLRLFLFFLARVVGWEKIPVTTLWITLWITCGYPVDNFSYPQPLKKLSTFFWTYPQLIHNLSP